MGGRTPPADILSIAGLQVGVPENYFFDRLTPEVRAAVRHAVQTLAGLGAEPTEIRLDGMEELNTLGRLVLSAEASSLWQKLLAARPRDFGNDVRQALEKGCAVSAADYLEAQRLRRKLSKQLGTLWDGIDCLLTPATPTTAPRIGETSIRIGGVEEDVPGREHALGPAVQCTRMAGAGDALRILEGPHRASEALRPFRNWRRFRRARLRCAGEFLGRRSADRPATCLRATSRGHPVPRGRGIGRCIGADGAAASS